jgi:lipopolysaccharide export system permease protein
MHDMTRLSRYVGTQLAVAILFIAVTLTVAVWLTQTLRFIDTIVNSGMPLGLIFRFLILLIPGLLSVILPIAVFVAVMFVYWKLMNDRELVVMQAIGLSPTELARPALIVAAFATGVAYGLSLYLMPASYRSFGDLQLRIRNDFAQVLLTEGVFTTVSDGLTLYARQRGEGGALHGLIVYDTREEGHPIIYTAVQGIVTMTAAGPRLTMQDGTYQETDPSQGRISVLYFDRMAISVADPGAEPGQRTRSPWERYLPELFNPPDLATDDPLRRVLTAEAHLRLAYPLYTLAFAVLGLAMITPAAAGRSRQRLAMMSSILAVIGLQAINFTLRNLANAQPALAPLMYLGPVAPIAIATLMMLVGRRAPRLQTRPPMLASLGAR